MDMCPRGPSMCVWRCSWLSLFFLNWLLHSILGNGWRIIRFGVGFCKFVGWFMIYFQKRKLTLDSWSLWKGRSECVSFNVGCGIFKNKFWGYNGIYLHDFETWKMRSFEEKMDMNNPLIFFIHYNWRKGCTKNCHVFSFKVWPIKST